MDDGAAVGRVSVSNRYEGGPLPSELLDRLATLGAQVTIIMEKRYPERGRALREISIVLIGDGEIARVHEEFLGDASPTDVITFPYGEQGEILISVDTARRQAREFAVSLDRELALYVVHGILHLCGYEDQSDSGRRIMADLQERLLQEVFVAREAVKGSRKIEGCQGEGP